jgi:hypothetical protein
MAKSRKLSDTSNTNDAKELTDAHKRTYPGNRFNGAVRKESTHKDGHSGNPESDGEGFPVEATMNSHKGTPKQSTGSPTSPSSIFDKGH